MKQCLCHILFDLQTLMLLFFIKVIGAVINCEWNAKEYIMSVTTDSSSKLTLNAIDIENRDIIRKLLIVSNTFNMLGKEMMVDKTNLREVVMTSYITNIGINCFAGCTSLEKINLPAELAILGQSSLDGCFKLKRIIIPTKVYNFGSNAIQNSGMESIIVLPAVSTVGKNMPKATFGEAEHLTEFIYCGNMNWGGSFTTVFLNSPIENSLPTVPLDFSGDVLWGYNVNKADVSNKCSEAKAEFETVIDWEYEKNHGYPDPEILPTSEEINIYFTSSNPMESSNNPIESSLENEHIDSSIEHVESSEDLLDSSFKSYQTSLENKDLSKSSNERENSFVQNDDVSSAKGYITDDILFSSTMSANYYMTEKNSDETIKRSVTKDDLTPSSITLYNDKEIYSSFMDVESSLLIQHSSETTTANRFDESSESIMTSEPPSITPEKSFIWKSEIATLIIQNTISATRADIVKEFGEHIHDYVGKLVVMPGVEILGANLMEESNYLREVIMADSVTTVGAQCFFDCPILNKIRLSNGLHSIGDKAFSNCPLLKTIVLPSNISKLGGYLVENSGLRTITLLNTTVYTNIALYVYANTKKLQNFYYCGDYYTGKNVQYYAFKGSSIQKIYVPTTFKDIFANQYSFMNYLATPSDIKEICDSADMSQKKDVNWDYEISNGFIPLPTPSMTPFASPTQSPTPSVDGFNDAIYWNKKLSVLSILPYKKVTRKDLISNIGNSIFDYVIKLVVRPGVVELGDRLMENSTFLFDVVLADTVTKIGDYCFSNCQRISRLRLSNNLKYIGDNAFDSVYLLNEIIFPKDITHLGNHIIKYSGIEKGIMLDTNDKVESVGAEVFADALFLEKFYYCGDWYIYDPYTSTAFKNSNKLANGYVNVYTTYKMTSFIGQHISMIVSTKDICKEAEEKQNEPIDWYYEVTYGFKQGEYPTTWKRDNYVLILQGEEIIRIDSILKWCRSDIRQYVGKILVKPGVIKLNDKLMKDSRGLEEVIMSDTVETIGNECFAYCPVLKKVRLSKNINSIGDKAFYFTDMLQNIVFPGNISNIGADIIAYSGLKVATMLKTDVKVNQISDSVFDKAYDLEEFYYCGDKYSFHPNKDFHAFSSYFGKVAVPTTFNDKYGDDMTDLFLGNAVKKMDISKQCSDANQYLDNDIDWEHELETGKFGLILEFVESSGLFKTSIKLLSSDDVQFALNGINRNKIKRIDVQNTDELGDNCFADCEELTTVMFGSKLEKIGKNCFSNCYKLSNVYLPMEIREIGSFAFSNCRLLREIVIPSNIISIGRSVFESNGIKKIYFMAIGNETSVSIATSAFGSMPEIELFVYCGSSFKKTEEDNYIDQRVSVTVGYLYPNYEFLGRQVIRDGISEVCKEIGDLNVKQFKKNTVNRMAISISFTILSIASVVAVVAMILTCFSSKAKYLLFRKDDRDQDDLIDIQISDEEIDDIN